MRAVNIAFYRKEGSATEAEIFAAAELANAHKFVGHSLKRLFKELKPYWFIALLTSTS